MIGTTGRSHQRFPAVLAVSLTMLCMLATGCGGGSSGPVNPAPTIIAAAFAGAGATPAAGDTLQLFFSEDVTLTGALLSDADCNLSSNGSLGNVTLAPSQLAPRAIAVTLGAGVSLLPGTTQVSLATTNDCITDLAGVLGAGGSPITISTSDGSNPVLQRITVAAIDDELNGTGGAGGTLQVPPNGWTLDLSFADNVGVQVSRTQITATVTVGTTNGPQDAGTNLMPYLSVLASNTTSLSLGFPTDMTIPATLFTLSCVVVDFSGLASNAQTITLTSRPFSNDLRPFETSTNPQQLWFLDFARDVESFTTSTISGGVSINVVAGANGRSDFDDILHVLGLLSPTPIPNVLGTLSSNDLVIATIQSRLLGNLDSLCSGANVAFTVTPPSAAFGSSSSVPYDAIGHSRISIAGSASTVGVLGVAIFDPSNATQNDNTRVDFSGTRLGVFLHTIANAGMGPPSASAFRLTFGPFAPSLGGTPIGDDPQDGQRLQGSLAGPRRDQIDGALADLGRFLAVVTAHECGHSMGLVRNGAMPLGLYGNDTVNFPGSQDGHIRTNTLFPVGATNVMSPSLSYSAAINAATGFNSLNLAYLREQVFYGN